MKKIIISDHAVEQATERFGIDNAEDLEKLVLEHYPSIQSQIESEETRNLDMKVIINDMIFVIINTNHVFVKTVIPNSNTYLYDRKARRKRKKQARKVHWSKRTNC